MPNTRAYTRAVLHATSGANDRLLSSIVGDVFNVKNYGAVGNGVADDKAAIQLAIDAAEVAGGIVLFPPGTYKVTGALGVAASDVHLIGWGATIRANYGNDNILFIGGASHASPISRVSVQGLGINVSTSTTSGAGIRVVHAREIEILNVKAGHTGMASPHKFVSIGDDADADDVKNIIIKDCYAEHNSADNCVELVSGAIAIIDGCFFNGPSPAPGGSEASMVAQVSTTRNWDGLIVSNCTGETWPRGLFKCVGGMGISNARFAYNLVEPGVSLSAISLFPVTSGGCYNVVVHGNQFNCDASAAGVGIRAAQSLGGTIRGLTLSSNWISNAGGRGVQIDSGSHVNILGNTVYNCGNDGTPGVTVGGSMSACLLHGNIIDGASGGMTYGIEWQAGSPSDRVDADNIVRGFATADRLGTP